MSSVPQVSVDVRDVSREEVDFYRDNGWAFLPGLISPEVATDLLARAKALMGEQGDANELRPVIDQESQLFNTRYRPDLEDELYRGLRTNEHLGRNAALLLGKDMAVRSLTNFVAVKLPRDLETDKPGKGPTQYHQDHGSMPTMGESLVFWIALEDVTPEMGSMRFYNGSHRLGWLAGDPLSWPQVQDFEHSDPVVYTAGDATAHGTMVVHGAPENRTGRSRWSYICNFFPDAAVYNGLAGRHTAGAEDALVAGQPFPDHPYYPLVYGG
jgi:ectoine hydroxylase-related dioxygenase (phytanoyl-CoA dioxygenase family)